MRAFSRQSRLSKGADVMREHALYCWNAFCSLEVSLERYSQAARREQHAWR